MSEELVTPRGKELEIVHVTNSALYKLVFKNGGELPKELEGMYTSPVKAEEAARRYLDSLPSARTKNTEEKAA